MYKFTVFFIIIYLVSLSNIVFSENIVSYNSTVIDGSIEDNLKSDYAVSVNILLRGDGQTYNPNLSYDKNYEIYKNRSKYFNNVENNIISSIDISDFKLTHKFSLVNGISGYITKSGIDKLKNNPDVLKILSDKIHASADSGNNIELLRAEDVWNRKINGVDITGGYQTVCIIDSGIDKTRPDMSGRIIDEYCYCHCGIWCGCCPNGQQESSNASDDNGHGTHVAGIVIANGNVTGVSPSSRIFAIKVMDSGGNINSSADVSDAISRCIANKSVYNITAIVMSFGTDDLFSNYCDSTYSQWSEEINSAIQNGILVVAATGNENNYTSISSPSCIQNVTSVGASYDQNFIGHEFSWGNCSVENCCNDSSPEVDNITCFTNRNIYLDVLAPGALINSTVPNGTCKYCNQSGYRELSGTSQAAPHVAGAAALLIQFEKLKNNRTLTPLEIETRFKETGKLIFDNETGLWFPRLDVYGAIFPVSVDNFSRVYDDDKHSVFRFVISNNYNNKTKSASWSVDLGDGTVINSTTNITLEPKETAMFFIEHNYSQRDVYLVNISIDGGSVTDRDDRSGNFSAGKLILRNFSLLYASQKERIFGFHLLNGAPYAIQGVNWTVYTGEQNISSDSLINMTSGKEMLFFVQYNYSSYGNYAVIANATNGNLSDSESMNIIV